MIETSDMQFDSRMVTAEETPEDHDVEVTLRPQTLAEYIGQDKVKENMAIYIQAAKRRGDPLDHVLLYGPPGLGKATALTTFCFTARLVWARPLFLP